MKSRVLIAFALTVVLFAPALAGDREESFWEAARQGELATVKRLIGEGVDINARTRYGATALSYACDKGHLDVIRFLLEGGANVDTKDEFYKITPLGWALFHEHSDIALLLLDAGAEGADQVLSAGVDHKNAALVAAALKSPQIDSSHVARAMEQAKALEDAEAILALLEAAEVKPAEHTDVKVAPDVLETYVGQFKNDAVRLTIDIRVDEGKLIAQATDQPSFTLRPLSETSFESVDVPGIKMAFAGRGGMIEFLALEQGGQTINFSRIVEVTEAVENEAASPKETAGAPVVLVPPMKIVRKPAANWPGFRGPQASGVADGQGVPLKWNVEIGDNVRWKTPIPGMANSSPIVWGDKIFVTTAISGAGDETFRTGLYGDVDSVDDESEHTFMVYALAKKTGKVLWERTVSRAVPGAKRHMKSTQANSTPVTDGKRVVALFGTVGVLVCHDMDGKQLWKTDVGVLDSGWFYDRSYQWGHASSPVIYKGLVIVQADTYADSFIAAYKLSDGTLAWKTERESVPSWGTPTVYRGAKRDELITNGNTVKGYEPATGKELWSLAPNSEVTVATPIVAHDLFYVTAGYAPVRPVYAIRPGASGDISLDEGTSTSEAIAWSNTRGGTYMPTPLAYGDLLYTCNNDGRVRVYEASTGEEVHHERVGGGGSFTASPIASDGRLYFTTEDGDIIVIQAGPSYEELARNDMGEVCMSTPAISDGLLVVRTMKHVYGLGESVVESANR